MLVPTKIIKPVDSLISISAYVLKLLQNGPARVDSLHSKFNEVYYKVITLESLLLSLNFLYMTDSVELKDETITIKI